MFRLTIGAIAAFVLLMVGAMQLDGGEGETSDGVPRGGGTAELLTAEVKSGRIQRTISAIGRLEAATMVEISSQLSGQVLEVLVDFNDPIRQGQPLAHLDRRGYQAHVVQAEAEAEMARENLSLLAAKLEKARAIENEAVETRRVFEARTDLARVRLEAAERQLARATSLAGKGIGAVTAAEDAQKERDTAAAAVREAEALAAAHEHTVSSRRAGSREAEAELANARAALSLRQAALALAELDLERSTIRSPIDGFVISRNVEEGQTVAVSLDAPILFTLAGDLTEMELHASVDETDIGSIAVGQAASFTVDAFPNRSFAATVRQIQKAPRQHEGVITYTVVLRTENAAGLLLPGMTAVVRVVVEETDNVLTVPLAALNLDADGTRRSDAAGDVLWVVGPNGRHGPRRVAFGADDGARIAVVSGELRSGERVVVGRVPQEKQRRLFGIAY